MKKENRTRRLITRFKPDEFEGIERQFKNSAFQKLSEYCRSVMLGEPVTIIQRDRSADEMLEELVLLRKELNAIGNNLNQAMKNINREHGRADHRLWMQLLLVINGKVEPAIGHIKERISEYAELWLQKLKAGKA